MVYEMKVEDVMTRNVIAVPPENPMSSLRQILRENRISGLPVTQGEDLVGIISLEDFIEWLAEKARVFVMDEPTNGIDVGAKQEIYALMNELARQGSGILWISSHMPELMDICDRILVMRNGSTVADVARGEFDEERLLALAIRN